MTPARVVGQDEPVQRVIEGVPGEPAPVWVQDRGGGPVRLRGHVVIEDLSDVLTAISARQGANGPLNPVTQYMLARAADQLVDRLIDDGPGTRESRDGVPRLLSSALGHQPFVEQVLAMSQHQMLRRWPLATDWYTDVVNYLMRPARFDPDALGIRARLPEWATQELGVFIRRIAETAGATTGNWKFVRVAEALQALWPDYPPVRDAMIRYREEVARVWEPIYDVAMHVYGLRPRSGVSISDVAWAFNAVQARETMERLAESDGRRTGARPHTTRTAVLLIAGAVTDAEGASLTPDEVHHRRPVTTGRWA